MRDAARVSELKHYTRRFILSAVAVLVCLTVLYCSVNTAWAADLGKK